MITTTKEDAEFLAGFIDQWLPVCGEKTAERARAVKTKLQDFVAMSDIREKQADSKTWESILLGRQARTIPVSVEGVVSAAGGGGGGRGDWRSEKTMAPVDGADGSVSVGYYVSRNEHIYDGKALIAAIDGAIANGARINVSDYDLSDLAVSPIADDEDADDYFCPDSFFGRF